MLANCGVDAEYVHRDFLYVVANHFAIWREARMSAEADKYLDENITIEDTVAFNKGMKIGRQFGAEDMKEQMLKDAVKGTIDESAPCQWQIISDDLDGGFIVNHNLVDGDRVKIIILKEE